MATGGEVPGTRAHPRNPLGGALPSFDGLRGMAATAIVVLHASIFAVWLGQPYLRDLLGQLRVGVEVFFVISGFLLYRPFIAARLDGRPRPGWRVYAVNRGARLYPAYWLALLVTVVVLGQGNLFTIKMWISHLLLLGVYREDTRTLGLPVSWTLSVELGFYVVLPFIAALADRTLRRLPAVRAEVVAIGAVAGIGLITQLVVANVHNYFGWVTTPFYLPVFAIGMAFALMHEVTIRRSEPHPLYTALARRSGVAWVLALVLLIVTAPFVSAANNFALRDSLWLNWVLMVAGTLFCVPAVFRPAEGRERAGVRRFLNARPIVYLGVISYGIYLWHYQILRVVRQDWFGWEELGGNALVQLPITYVVTVAAATASWFLLERPVMRWVRARRAGGGSSAPQSITDPSRRIAQAGSADEVSA